MKRTGLRIEPPERFFFPRLILRNYVEKRIFQYVQSSVISAFVTLLWQRISLSFSLLQIQHFCTDKVSS